MAEIVDLALAVEATGRLSGSRLACFWHLDRERPARPSSYFGTVTG